MKKLIELILCAATMLAAATSCEFEEPAVKGTCTYTVNVMCVTTDVEGDETVLQMSEKIHKEMMAYVRSWTADWGGKTEESALKAEDTKAVLAYAVSLTAIKNTYQSLNNELKNGTLGTGTIHRIYEVSLVRDSAKKITDIETFEFSYPQ